MDSSEIQKNFPPGFVITALRGGSGKTVLTIGIIAALREAGLNIAPFKKGPDYIDAGWLSLVAGQCCYNLDTFLVKENVVIDTYLTKSSNSDIAVIEGNRGLYDGIDLTGSTSTAEVAKLLQVPVILSVDCTKSTRTMAALVLGCIMFDPKLKIEGVILNKVAGQRHETKLRTNIEHFCNLPVIGAVPKLDNSYFPERHMGLIPTFEHSWAKDSIDAASMVAKKYIDLDAVQNIAFKYHNIIQPHKISKSNHITILSKDYFKNNNIIKKKSVKIKIGVIKDSAFQFYYPDNIEALENEGAEIVYINSLFEQKLPDDIGALYIGGGFPETHAIELAKNTNFKEHLKAVAEKGMPIYAECGGLMFLGKELVICEKKYSMVNLLPLSFGISKKPQGHGYTSIIVDNKNSFFDIGTKFNGHEFRYSYIIEFKGSDNDMVFQMERGTGIINKRDGFRYKNVLASYNHIHAKGISQWAKSMVHKAHEYLIADPEYFTETL